MDSNPLRLTDLLGPEPSGKPLAEGSKQELDRMCANVRFLKAHGLLRMKEQDPRAHPVDSG